MDKLIAGENIKRGEMIVVKEDGLAYRCNPDTAIGGFYAKGHHTNGFNLNCTRCGLTWEQYRDDKLQGPCIGSR